MIQIFCRNNAVKNRSPSCSPVDKSWQFKTTGRKDSKQLIREVITIHKHNVILVSLIPLPKSWDQHGIDLESCKLADRGLFSCFLIRLVLDWHCILEHKRPIASWSVNINAGLRSHRITTESKFLCPNLKRRMQNT